MNRRDVFKTIAGIGLAPITAPEVLEKPSMVYGIVLDESSSMFTQQKDVIKGFNEHVAALKRDEPKNLETRLFVVTFQTKVTRAALNIPLKEMPEITEEEYVPSGMTALYDAIAFAMAEMKRVGGKDASYLLTIITDGEENSSVEVDQHQIAAMLREAQATGKWTVSYVGAKGLDLAKERAALAADVVMAGSAMTYDKSDAGMATMFAHQTRSYTSLATERSMKSGNVASMSFYDATNLKE